MDEENCATAATTADATAVDTATAGSPQPAVANSASSVPAGSLNVAANRLTTSGAKARRWTPPQRGRQRKPVLFAHRGGKAHAPENTLDAFTLALELGATGLETDVHLSRDGHPMLHHDGASWHRGVRRTFGHLDRSSIDSAVPTLADLYAACGTAFELSVDVKAHDATEALRTVAAVIDAARAAGAEQRLWLCHGDTKVLAATRAGCEAKLVHSTRLRRMRDGPERHAADLSAQGIDGVNLHHKEWTGGLAALFHRFELWCLGWDAQFERVARSLANMGVDAIYGDHVDRLREGTSGT